MQTVALQSAQINALLTWELSSIYTSALARRVSPFSSSSTGVLGITP